MRKRDKHLPNLHLKTPKSEQKGGRMNNGRCTDAGAHPVCSLLKGLSLSGGNLGHTACDGAPQMGSHSQPN